ncbi:MAG: polymorphic toxin type 47 domain-containing protein [Deltaproteobacteria bacterium]
MNAYGRRVPWVPGPNDVDFRGTGRSIHDAIDEAFRRTGLARDQFTVTRWGRTSQGKSFPVEWSGPGGAQVNLDFPHLQEGPDVPHVGWQRPGSRSSGEGARGHIYVDEVPSGR